MRTSPIIARPGRSAPAPGDSRQTPGGWTRAAARHHVVGVAAGLLACVLLPTPAARAQKYQPPPPPLTTDPCVPSKKDPCRQPDVTPASPATAERFPFPGENPGPGAAPAASSTPAASQGTAPAAGAQPGFPFPGEPPATQPAHPFPGEPPEPGAASSSGSSSSSSSSSAEPGEPADPGAPALKDEGSTGSTRFERHRLPRVENKDNREEQDLEVSKYYASTGDFKAAYLRAKDAVTTVPDDPEGHFLLAEAARRSNKPDEARSEYETYLKLDPGGSHEKAARVGLGGLPPAGPKPK